MAAAMARRLRVGLAVLRTTFVATALVACSQSGGRAVLDGKRIDGKPIDGYQVPATITIRGVTSSRTPGGPSPVAAIMVSAYDERQPTTAIASTTSDATGSYALAVSTGGKAIALHLQTSSPSHVDTYRYFFDAFDADRSNVALDVLTPAAYAGIYTTTGVAHTAGTAILEVEVVAFEGGAIVGATLTPTTGGPTEYTDGEVVVAGATVTSSDGLGFVLDAPVGQDLISAVSDSQILEPVPIDGFAGALTMATIRANAGAD